LAITLPGRGRNGSEITETFLGGGNLRAIGYLPGVLHGMGLDER